MPPVDERCEWCRRSTPLETLTTVTMAEGERIACCPRCASDARETAEKLAALERGRAPCDGCTAEFPREDLEDAILPDGTVVACCPDCLSEVPGRTHAVADETDRAETSERAVRCDQCRERVDVEPFSVTTIDGRTEELCPGCKATAEDSGVVADVRMRESEAREILGLDAGASDAAIREAFLVQIKRAHPDRKTGSRSAFGLVKEAYDRLN